MVEEHDKEVMKLEDEIQELKKQLEEREPVEPVVQVDDTKIKELEQINSQFEDDLNQIILQKEEVSKELETLKDKVKTQDLAKGNLVCQLFLISLD